MLYSVPYILMFLFLVVLAIIVEQRHDDKTLCAGMKMLGVTVFFLFFGFRGFIWHDWTIYYRMFQDRAWSDFLEYDYFQNREPGWMLFQLLCKSVCDNYQFLVLVTTTINTALLLRFFRRYSDNILLGLAVYLAFNGFVISINLMRNSIAIFLFLNSLEYIEARKPFKYLSICLLAASFHLSALMFIPLYFILHRHINKWVYLALVIFAHVSMFIGFSPILTLASTFLGENEIMADKLEAYSELGRHADSRTIIMQRLLTCVLVFCYYERLMKMRPSNVLFINSLLCYILGIALTSEFSEVSTRVGIIFIFAYWILWVDLFKCFRYPNNRKLFIGFAVFYVVFYMLISINTPVNEYQNYLLGNAKSYQECVDKFNKTFKEPD